MDFADLFLPTISFCQAIKWWKFCRVKPRGRNCWLPWNC